MVGFSGDDEECLEEEDVAPDVVLLDNDLGFLGGSLEVGVDFSGLVLAGEECLLLAFLTVTGDLDTDADVRKIIQFNILTCLEMLATFLD